ncbi:hypothetical protein FRAHR75_190034 [Frankia sp. Hr75.2]|nr:hypothetical protein FRAHR75_190034 [Frankia sp. Hr75.2]
MPGLFSPTRQFWNWTFPPMATGPSVSFENSPLSPSASTRQPWPGSAFRLPGDAVRTGLTAVTCALAGIAGARAAKAIIASVRNPDETNDYTA